MSSGKSRLCQWVDGALHWGAQRSWITGLRSHSQCEVVLGIETQVLKVVCFVGLVLDYRISYMLHKCSVTGLQSHPGGKVFGKHSTEFLSLIGPGTMQKGQSGLEEKIQHTPPWNIRAQLAHESLWKNKGSFDYTSAGKWHGQNSFTVPQISFRKKCFFLLPRQ